MHTLRMVIGYVWLVFWIGWLVSAVSAKEGSGRGGRRRALGGTTAVAVIVIVRFLRGGSLAINSPALGAVGTVLFAVGLALAIWARVHIGRNWGMPMTQKAEPELVTSGPYRLIRHPIYSGLLLALLGTALLNNLIGLAIVALLTGYFYYATSVEERNLTATFPEAYPAYRAHTKRLIPFVL
jgi:protein-S-isoprenylcysteine O-methyltransferase Ste14